MEQTKKRKKKLQERRREKENKRWWASLYLISGQSLRLPSQMPFINRFGNGPSVAGRRMKFSPIPLDIAVTLSRIPHFHNNRSK